MAIIPGTRYAAQTDTDSEYPHGKARNAGAYQDGTGTPLEKDWLNDQWGFGQALLEEAGITPSGTPDTAFASQYLEAMRSITALRYAHYNLTDSLPTANDTPFALTDNASSPNVANGYALAGNYVTLPRFGRYLMAVSGEFGTSRTGADAQFSIGFQNVSTVFPPIIGTIATVRRPSTNVAHAVHITMIGVGHYAGSGPDPSRNVLGVHSFAGGSETIFVQSASLFVLRLGD